MRNYVKYLLSLVLFGFNGIVASQIALTSYEIVYLRTFIGSVLLVAIFLLTGGRFHIRQFKRDSLFIALSGIALGAGWLFLFEAYQRIGVSFSSLLYYCGPVIVMALSPVIFKEKLTWPKVFGFVIVLAGLFLVNGKAALQEGSHAGLFCGLMSAVLFAVMIIFNKQSRNITGFENATIQLTASFLTVAVFTIVREGPFVSVLPCDIPWILFLGLVNTGLGCYLYFSSIGKLPVQTIAVCGYLEPLSAVVFSALLLGEHMTLIQSLGALCIIGGAMIVELVKSHK